MKSWRQSQILDVIDHEPVASQEALRKMLETRGIGATQATISRDLKELGLVSAPATAPTCGPEPIGAALPSANSCGER